MESGIIPQRNVVGVITGLMGSGKTTLLCHLFGKAPPDLYTSTGVAEKSLRGMLHHMVQHLSDNKAWKRLSKEDICELIAPFIRGKLKKSRVDILAHELMQSIDPSQPISPVQQQTDRELMTAVASEGTDHNEEFTSNREASTNNNTYNTEIFSAEENNTNIGEANTMEVSQTENNTSTNNHSTLWYCLYCLMMCCCSRESEQIITEPDDNTVERITSNRQTTDNTEESNTSNRQTGNTEESNTSNRQTGNTEESNTSNRQTGNTEESNTSNRQTGNTEESNNSNRQTGNTEESNTSNRQTTENNTETAQFREKSYTGRIMVPLIRGPTTKHHPVLEFVHMIDTGGQPELMEVMPSLIHNANLALVLVDLRYRLNEHQKTDYHSKGQCYERQKSYQYITSRDIVLKLASTLQAKKSCHEAFNLLVVATHRDCVGEDLEDRVEALDDELHSVLLPTFENNLRIFKTPDKIAYVLNLKNPDSNDKKALELICEDVRSQDLGRTFDTPTSFFLFEQDLLHFAKTNVNRSILSLDECKQVGERLKMSGEMVEAALVLFHRQNTFLYFRHVLPNHVFIDPQVPLDIVNGIVRFSYKVDTGNFRGFPVKYVNQLKNGIISKEMLSYNPKSTEEKLTEEHDQEYTISPHFKKQIYEPQHAIKLLCHTFTLAPLHMYTDDNDELGDDENKGYLMMCLKPAIPDEELNDNIPKSSDTVPLVIKFSNGCVPLGCFGSTISCLLSKYGWKVLTKRRGVPECLAHNIATLRDPHIPVNIVLVDYIKHFEIHISSVPSCNQHSKSNTFSQVRRKVFGAIEKVFEIMQLDIDKIKISSAIICTCGEVTVAYHFAELTNTMLYCSETAKTFKPSKEQQLWMSEDSNSKPDLPELLRLKIPEKIGTQYTKFGIFLLHDTNGELVLSIEKSCHYHSEDIVIKILQHWLTREPTPVTWESLIETLRKSDLNALADYVQQSPKTH